MELLDELWSRYRLGDESAREPFTVEACRRFVKRSVEGETRGMNLSEEQREDLDQHAKVGITQAMRRVDLSQAEPPADYLITWARLEVRKEKTRWAKRHVGPTGETIRVYSLDEPAGGCEEERREATIPAEGSDPEEMLAALQLRIDAGLTRNQLRALVMTNLQKMTLAEVARELRRSLHETAGIIRAGNRKLARATGSENARVERGRKLIIRSSNSCNRPAGRNVWASAFATNQQVEDLLWRLKEATGHSYSEVIRRAIWLAARERLGERIPRALRIAPRRKAA